jgi:hypothetical protein
VGLSVTHRSERKFPTGAWALPAVLDTGFNRVLEIDERRLERWTGLRKEYLDILSKRSLKITSISASMPGAASF